MIAQNAPAGVPDGLSPDELERWSNELVAFLTSEGVPSTFRGWARTHADLLDAYMASAEDLDAEDLDAEGDSGDEEGEAAPARAVPPAQTSPRAATAPRRQQAAAPEPREFVLRVPEQAGKLGAGVIIGALALLAIFGVRALASGGGGSLPATGTGTAPAFNQQRADVLQTLLQQNPSDQDALFELGEMTFEAGRFEDSISWLSRLVALDPTNRLALNDIGTANFNLGRPDEAKVWWQKTLAVDANDVQAHYNMGFVYANAEPRNLASAVNEWETVVRLDPASQLGQTAKVHVDGLRAQLVVTPAAAALATPTAAAP
jgi:hypothetical protein